tara:strand:- start:260 stop:616 length:357 start_codon:yes stop_codon:yes gene_type:complete
MSYVILKLQAPLNASVEIGDVVYYAETQTIENTEFDSSANYNLVGVIQEIQIDNGIASLKCGFNGNAPNENDFLFFVKSKVVNTSSIKGYYGLVNFVNTSRGKAEMYSAFCEADESSK